MNVNTAMQGRLSVAQDYYMPGRDDIEPGTNEAMGTGRGAQAASQHEGKNFLGEDGLTFADVLDVLNPLQHLPLIGDLYRSLTGDQISAGARMAGGTLYGGPIGFVSSLANTVVEEATGKDIAGNVMALFDDAPGDGDGTQVAQAPKAQAGAALASLEGQAASAADLAALAPAAGPVASPAAGPATAYPAFTAATPYPALIPMAKTSSPQSLAAGQDLPALSPAAFQVLMSSVNGQSQATPRSGLTAGGDAAPAAKGSIREAGMEINRLLRPHANAAD